MRWCQGIACLLGLAAVFFLVGGTEPAWGGGKKKKIKLDPEIRAAQEALKTAKAKLIRALSDEVVGEKGKIEVKVIDQLRLALDHVNKAIAHAAKAQKLDKGGD